MLINLFYNKLKGVSVQLLSRYLQKNSHFQKNMAVFKFSDYDCIGFDLDSTIIRYNITNLLHLEYNLISNFLINKRKYGSKYLKEPLSNQDIDFVQKGLVFDFEKGNILKLTPEGKVHKASHGTRIMSTEEMEIYYPNREWKISSLFSQDPLIAWNGPLSLKIRTLLDVFDSPAGLVFARAVDTLDEQHGQPLSKYEIWPDILDAFIEMFSREHLKNNIGNFYSEIKKNPDKYIYKTNPEVLAWIRRLKEKRKTFLITGSNLDFVNVTTSYAIGEDWKSLFDIIVCYAKKPAFFTNQRPFYSLKNCYEDKILNTEDLELGGIYNQGNWSELLAFFSRILEKNNPKCLYIGDNMLQDIYAPSVHAKNCDTMVISEEQAAEGMLNHGVDHSHKHILSSKVWESFFTLENSEGLKDSFWNHIIKKYSKICIPSLDVIARKPLDESYSCFIQDDNDIQLNGYFPAKPVTVDCIGGNLIKQNKL